MDGAADGVIVQPFFIQNYIRTDNPAAGAVGNRFDAAENGVRAETLSAYHAVIPVGRTVQFIHRTGTGSLMESVNVLGDHGSKTPLFFPLRQCDVCHVGTGGERVHLIPVETEELFRVTHEITVGQQDFRRCIV